jgi:hypothetical protein
MRNLGSEPQAQVCPYEMRIVSPKFSIYPWQKPKGMHWSTFERLRQREKRASSASLLAMWV